MVPSPHKELSKEEGGSGAARGLTKNGGCLASPVIFLEDAYNGNEKTPKELQDAWFYSGSEPLFFLSGLQIIRKNTKFLFLNFYLRFRGC